MMGRVKVEVDTVYDDGDNVFDEEIMVSLIVPLSAQLLCL